MLLSAADRLFAWRRPALPDNLCFFRSDGGPWLVTIAAERLGYIELTQLERVRLAHHAPQLASVLAYQAAHDAVLATFERRLEERVDPLVEELLGYARPLAGSGDGLDSVADALQMWVLSDDDLRVEVALEMIASLRIEVLRKEVDRSCAPGSTTRGRCRRRWRATRCCASAGGRAAGASSMACSSSWEEDRHHSPADAGQWNCLPTWMTAGPSSTMNRVGKMHPIIGMSILIGAFWPASSAR